MAAFDERHVLAVAEHAVSGALEPLAADLSDGVHALPLRAADFDGDPVGDGFLESAPLDYMNHRKVTIYGGSNEIQKNIICKAVLGL